MMVNLAKLDIIVMHVILEYNRLPAGEIELGGHHTSSTAVLFPLRTLIRIMAMSHGRPYTVLNITELHQIETQTENWKTCVSSAIGISFLRERRR